MSDVYKIGIAIMLGGDINQALSMLSHRLLGVHKTVGQINSGIGKWKTALLGAAGVMAGGAILIGLGKIAKAGSDVNHQLELMKIQGMNAADVQLSASKAMQVSGSVLTSTYSENLAHIRELRYAFGDTPDALKYLEDVTKSNSVLNSIKGGDQDQVWELVKSLEQKGLTADPKEFMSYVSEMTKAVVASGGKVTPAQFFSAFTYGRTAMLGWDETFSTQYLPRLIQSMSGGSGSGTGGPGNALMSAFAKVVQGQMPKAAAEEFSRMGLTPHGIAHIKGSSQTQIVGGIKGADLFEANPYAWVQQILMPALAEHGVTSQNDIIAEISKMFPVRTASSIISEMGLQGQFKLGDQSPFEKDARLQREAFDQKMSYDELMKNDYDTMMVGFHAQWKSLTEAVGQPLTEPGGLYTRALAPIIDLMHQAALFAQSNPAAIKYLAEGLAIIGGALIVGGLVALGGAMFALAGTGAIIAALAFGLAALAALNWKTIEDVARELGIIAPKAAPLHEGAHERMEKKFGNPWKDIDDANGKHSYNAIPPSNDNKSFVVGDVTMDGNKVGDIVFKRVSRSLNGPNQGSAHFDTTSAMASVDYGLARG